MSIRSEVGDNLLQRIRKTPVFQELGQKSMGRTRDPSKSEWEILASKISGQDKFTMFEWGSIEKVNDPH